jgi:hypothetical protein
VQPPDGKLTAPLLPEANGALREVALHYVPKFDVLVDAPYTDFLRAINSQVRVVRTLQTHMTPLQEKVVRVGDPRGTSTATRGSRCALAQRFRHGKGEVRR